MRDRPRAGAPLADARRGRDRPSRAARPCAPGPSRRARRRRSRPRRRPDLGAVGHLRRRQQARPPPARAGGSAVKPAPPSGRTSRASRARSRSCRCRASGSRPTAAGGSSGRRAGRARCGSTASGPRRTVRRPLTTQPAVSEFAPQPAVTGSWRSRRNASAFATAGSVTGTPAAHSAPTPAPVMSSEAFAAPSVKFQPPVAVCCERRNAASASRIGCGASTAASPSVPKMSSDSDDAAPGSYSRRPSNSASVSATKLRSAVISVGSMPAACAASSERARSVPRGPAPDAAQSACARSCALGPSPTRTSAGCTPPAASAVSPNPPSPEPFGLPAARAATRRRAARQPAPPLHRPRTQATLATNTAAIAAAATRPFM